MVGEQATTPCIEWTGTRDRQGYGITYLDGKTLKASRAAWIKAHGPIPRGMCVLHRCDNPPCYNVEHLWLGTRSENNRDAAAKGRSRNGYVGATHCKHGHEFTPENTYITPNGHRRCRACHRAQHTPRQHPNKSGLCKNGHVLDEHGYVNPRTQQRACRICVNAWRKEWRAARKAALDGRRVDA